MGRIIWDFVLTVVGGIYLIVAAIIISCYSEGPEPPERESCEEFCARYDSEHACLVALEEANQECFD